MFDALLGRKFTAKCKHAIKCIYERLKPIRNRKQAVVNILKNDIAVLLRNGSVEHAFGRMDELIAEKNRLVCYDLIEKFCEDVLMQLPLLQKQREFPPEDREAMSTLIFAAARFSDLPELCDLRQVFTERYGSTMEMSVNPEFQDKLATKAISAARKLQLMKNIANEFSVNWDSESFEYRITNSTAAKCDLLKKKDAHLGSKALPVSEKDGLFKHVVTEAKDIHIISHEPEPTRKIKPWADEPENLTPSPISSSKSLAKSERNRHVNCTEDWQRKNETPGVSSRAREVLDPINQDRKVVEQHKSKDDRVDRTKVPPDTREVNGTDGKYWRNGATTHKRSSRAQVILKSNGEEYDVMEQIKSNNETGVRHVVPPFVQEESNGTDAKEPHDIVYKRSTRSQTVYKAEQKQAVRQQEFEDNDKPRKVTEYAPQRNTNDLIGSDGWDKDVVHHKPRQARQEADLAAEEGRVVEPQKPNNNRAFHMIPPPYVKAAVGKAGANSENAKPSSQPTHEGVSATGEMSSSKPVSEGVFAANDKSNKGAYKDLPKDELDADDERAKPRSVRRKQQKPPVVQEVDRIIQDDEPVPRIPHGQRRRSSRPNTNRPHDNYDEEEKAMDKLLMQYSKKGLPDQPSIEHRTRTLALPPDHTLREGEAGQCETNGRYQIRKLETVKAAHQDDTINDGEANQQQSSRRHRIVKAEPVQVLPADHVAQDREAALRQAYSRYRAHRPESVHPPERAVSLRPEPVTPKGMNKGPARSSSMQPDLPSPHPRIPDYEELAARFAALKKG